MFLIIYCKIIDLKKNGLEFEGPFYGPECTTMGDAHKACSEIVTNSKDHILIKVYDSNEFSYNEAKDTALIYFKKIFEQMSSIQEICDAPKRKKTKN